MATKIPHSCTVVRRRLVTHSTLALITGQEGPAHTEWETGPCNVPLFTDAERTRGTCRSCAEGWTHPHNYPVET